MCTVNKNLQKMSNLCVSVCFVLRHQNMMRTKMVIMTEVIKTNKQTKTNKPVLQVGRPPK